MKPSFAIIGCGRIARRHAEQINKVGTLLAVCDIVYENAFELSQQYNCNLYLSIEELLENEPTVDIVSICTPNGLHAMHSIQSLQAHKHVLCEKPLCIAWRPLGVQMLTISTIGSSSNNSSIDK